VFDRLGVGIVDLIGVYWLQRRAIRADLIDEVVGPEPGAVTTISAPVSGVG
jgi:hypothetical protein